MDVNDGTGSRERLVRAAVEAFAERGFHATTTRDIAARAGMSPAALYVHHRSKETVLFEVARDGHLRTLEAVRAARTAAGDPVAAWADMVRVFTAWHCDHRTTARVVQYERQALTPEHRAEVNVPRRAIEQEFREALAAGVAAGSFHVDAEEVAPTALAVLSMGIDVARWFRPDGPRTAAQVADGYAELALRMAGAVRVVAQD